MGRIDPTYGAATSIAGMAVITGTRTVLYVGRNGLGTNCYGDGTADKSLHGKKALDGTMFCYDPTTNSKGSHAYPYRYQMWAYDLGDLASVKAGKKKPWQIVPYAVWPFTLPMGEGSIRSAALLTTRHINSSTSRSSGRTRRWLSAADPRVQGHRRRRACAISGATVRARGRGANTVRPAFSIEIFDEDDFVAFFVEEQFVHRRLHRQRSESARAKALASRTSICAVGESGWLMAACGRLSILKPGPGSAIRYMTIRLARR